MKALQYNAEVKAILRGSGMEGWDQVFGEPSERLNLKQRLGEIIRFPIYNPQNPTKTAIVANESQTELFRRTGNESLIIMRGCDSAGVF